MIKKLIPLILVSLIFLSGCAFPPERNVVNGQITLNAGEAKLILSSEKPIFSEYISGGYFPSFYVEDSSVARLEQRSDGLYLIGVKAGETRGVFTNSAYLGNDFKINSSGSAKEIVEKALSEKPIKIIVS